jgi:hypothetical protein
MVINKLIKIELNLLCTALFIFSVATFAQQSPQQSPQQPPAQPAPMVLSFPVNATQHISVEITIPDRFIPIVGQDKVAEAIKRGIVEFIPKTDQNLSKWTELITIIPLDNNSGIQAHTFRDAVLGELKDKTKNFIMVNSAFKNEKEYQVATALARYQLDGRTEILYFYAISGPVSSVSIQYIKAISQDEDLAKLLNELSAIFAKYVSIRK